MIFKRRKEYQSSPYNKNALKFFYSNSLTFDDINRLTENIIEPKEIDSIVEHVAIYGEEMSDKVSIANVYGYAHPKTKDLFQSINDFFDDTKDGYYTRSIDMLSYKYDTIIPGLSRSFTIEPMKLKEISDDAYFIGHNGMHRFTVLRIMYLIEKSRLSNPEQEEKLKEKYTIPVVTKKLDIVKTYCVYLLRLFDPELNNAQVELGLDYHFTGRIKITRTDEKIKLTDEELIIYTNEMMQTNKLTIPILIRVSSHIEKNPRFKAFLEAQFPRLLKAGERFIEYKEKHPDVLDLYSYDIPDKKEDAKWTL